MDDSHAMRVREHFNSGFTDYDVCCNKVVPRNEELQKMLVQSIPFKAEDKLRMLDLGIGTGLTTWHVLNRFSNAHIDGIDFSSEMLENTSRRLGKFNGNISLINADFTKCSFKGKYDVIFSAVAIHNLIDEEKRKICGKIYASLNAGGCFVNADFIKFKSAYMAENAVKFYENYLRENLAGRELEHWLRHAKEDDFSAALDDQFAWLKEAGFSHTECIWIYQNVAVISAVK